MGPLNQETPFISSNMALRCSHYGRLRDLHLLVVILDQVAKAHDAWRAGHPKALYSTNEDKWKMTVC